MLIAVSTDGRELSSAVSGHFETCSWLLLIDADDETPETVRAFEAVENTDGAAALAGMIIDRDCEAVITGALTPSFYDVFAKACISRYCGSGLTAIDALRSMDRHTLEILRDADNRCQGEHIGGECNCGEEH